MTTLQFLSFISQTRVYTNNPFRLHCEILLSTCCDSTAVMCWRFEYYLVFLFSGWKLKQQCLLCVASYSFPTHHNFQLISFLRSVNLSFHSTHFSNDVCFKKITQHFWLSESRRKVLRSLQAIHITDLALNIGVEAKKYCGVESISTLEPDSILPVRFLNLLFHYFSIIFNLLYFFNQDSASFYKTMS